MTLRKATFLALAGAILVGVLTTVYKARLFHATIDVELREGVLTGLFEKGVYSFKGIPYAVPPVGSLRWVPPQPPSSWAGKRKAFDYGEVCLQTEDQRWDGALVGSEDCLTLNIWTPQVRPLKQLPVLVFVHGGVGFWGSGAGFSETATGGFPMYEASRLSELGPAVVVTLNYRLGPLGNFAHPALPEAWPFSPGKSGTAMGNYALVDLVEALRWVQGHITSFGGDPGRVLLLGQSSGADYVAALLSIEEAKGLFSSVGLQSGRYLTQRKEGAFSRGRAMARKLGCHSAECLRAKSPRELWAAVSPSSVLSGTGVVLEKGWTRFPNGVPVVIGSNLEEGATFSSMGGQSTPIRSGQDFRRRLGPFVQDRSHLEEVATLYDPAKFGRPEDALAAFLGDMHFHCSARRMARLLAGAGKASVWRYLFAYRPPEIRSDEISAGHGMELPFLFSNFEARLASRSPHDLKLSHQMIRSWVDFALHGAPAPLEGVSWSSYDSDRDNLLELNQSPRENRSFRKTECDVLDGLS